MGGALGVILFILGSALVGLCLLAIPGPAGEATPPQAPGPHGHH
jgi:hypothetical protein